MELGERFYSKTTSNSFDDNRNDSQRFCEVQAIILAHYSCYNIHPLLQSNNNTSKPKFLLPFCNKPIITYPLRLLEINGFNEILIVIIDEFIDELTNFLDTQYEDYNDNNPSTIEILTVSEEDLG